MKKPMFDPLGNVRIKKASVKEQCLGCIVNLAPGSC